MSLRSLCSALALSLCLGSVACAGVGVPPHPRSTTDQEEPAGASDDSEPPPADPAPAAGGAPADPTPPPAAAQGPAAAPPAVPVAEPVPEATAAGEPAEEPGDEGAAEEAESEAEGSQDVPAGLLYSRDLSDPDLLELWKSDLGSLGSISVGFADEGRLINGVQLGTDEAWIRERPDLAYGTQETVNGLAEAFRAVHQQFPDSAPARLSHIGLRDGGYLRPHRSHQSGRDADIGFFYKGDRMPSGRQRVKAFDLARNWALVRALVTRCDVQMILVDKSVQKVLRAHAVAAGEDRAWVESLFHTGLIKHARRHRDHFHVRFYAGRSQELGRRIQPLLALRPEHNLSLHKVKRGQSLGLIAHSYGVSVQSLLKANQLRTNRLHVGQQLKVPLRGPCTRCPLPPPVVVPPRRLPPVRPVLAAASPPRAAELPAPAEHASPEAKGPAADAPPAPTGER